MSDYLITGMDHYAEATLEDRCAPRTRIRVPATLRIKGGRAFQTVVNDLSLAGFNATAINRVAPGTLCFLMLPGLESLPAQVMWWDSSQMGAGFENLLAPIVLEGLLNRWQARQVWLAV